MILDLTALCEACRISCLKTVPGHSPALRLAMLLYKFSDEYGEFQVPFARLSSSERVRRMSSERLRRSSRIPKEIPILLVGSNMEGKTFSEQAKTVLLSRHGRGHRFGIQANRQNRS